MSHKNSDYYFLKGGGEMGQLIREKDWSKTALGSPEDWPQSLRTMVAVMLDNPFGMYIAWGKEYIQLYNDGYRPILGITKHPQALGISSRETFSEIWHIIESMFAGVMDGVAVGFSDFMLPLDRNGYVETCYFDFAYSPIRLDDGEVGGILVTVTETTDKKKAEDELNESKKQLEFAIDAAQLGTFDFNPITNKFTANNRLKGWFGLPDNEQIELTNAINAIHPDDQDRVVAAIEAALEFSSGGKFDIKYTIVHPETRIETIVHAKGKTWFNDQNIAFRLNGTLEDVTEQTLAQRNTIESESNLKLMVSQAPVAITIMRGLDYTVEIANKHALEISGRTEEQILGKPIFTSMPELQSQGIKELLDDVITTGNRFTTAELPVELLRNNVLEIVYINFSYDPLYDVDGNINGIMAIGFDVTDQVIARKKVEDSEKRYNLMLMQSPFAFLILKGKDMVVHLANESMKEVLGKGNDIEGRPIMDVLPEIKDQAFSELLINVYESGVPFSANEMLTQLTRNYKLEDVYFNFVCQPYYEADKTISGVTVIAYDVTSAVLANKKIEESEKRFRNLIAQAVHPIMIFKGEELILEIANDALFELWMVGEEVIGKPFLDILPEMKDQPFIDLMLDVLHNGVTNYGNEQPAYFSRSNGDVDTVYFNFIYLPFREPDGVISGVLVQAYDVTEQVLARQKIEESEQSVRTLVENAPFPISVYTGQDMRITLANQSIIDAWGKGNDVIGKLYTDILPELKDQQIFDQVQTVYNTGIPFQAKNQRVDLVMDGVLKSFYFNYNFTPLFDRSGKVYGVMNTAAEVTELHEAKQKVEESEKRFRDSVQQAPLGIAIFRGPDFITEQANDTYLMIIDKKPEEFIGRPLFAALPEVKEAVQPLFEEVITTGIPFSSDEFPVTLKRMGKLEHAFFNLVYHPLKEDDGSISGIMVVGTEVTETVKAKHLLEESEKHFRHMVMQSPIPMTILRGEKFIIESANKAMFNNVWRKKEADVIGKSILEVFPELREQKYPDLLHQVFTSGRSHTEKEAIAYIQGDDGMLKFYLDFEYAPLFDLDGIQVSGIMITVNDVTDKVEARKKVEEAEERSRLAAEATELATWEFDLETNEMIHTRRLAEIYGHDLSKKLTHEEIRSQIHSIDRVNIVEKAYKKALKTGIYYFEARLIKADQSIAWIRLQGKTIYNENNLPVKLVGTLRDITEDKQIQQELLEREQKFRLLADSMPQHIWTSDPEGNLNYFNQSVFNYSGLSLEQITNDGWLQIVHPDDREKNNEEWLRSIKTGKDFLFEHRFRKHNGEYRWQLSRAIPQKDAHGKIQMWVGTSTDIQDQKMFADELEKQVYERTKELNQKNIDLVNMNKELQSFAYISSHDLQEPLRKIQTFASLLKNEEAQNLTKSGIEMFNRMQNSAERMQTLIQDLLAYSRTNTEERIFEPTDLNSIVEDVKEDLNEELKAKKAIIEADHLGTADIIPFQFRQLMLNLISNSLKFAHPERLPYIKIESEIARGNKLDHKKLSPQDKYFHITLSDNGIGFEQQYSEKIFEVFQRLHGKNEYHGTGIGLSIVNKIVENHHGHITATSNPNKGATFDIYIPAR